MHECNEQKTHTDTNATVNTPNNHQIYPLRNMTNKTGSYLGRWRAWIFILFFCSSTWASPSELFTLRTCRVSLQKVKKTGRGWLDALLLQWSTWTIFTLKKDKSRSRISLFTTNTKKQPTNVARKVLLRWMTWTWLWAVRRALSGVYSSRWIWRHGLGTSKNNNI